MSSHNHQLEEGDRVKVLVNGDSIPYKGQRGTIVFVYANDDHLVALDDSSFGNAYFKRHELRKVIL